VTSQRQTLWRQSFFSFTRYSFLSTYHIVCINNQSNWLN